MFFVDIIDLFEIKVIWFDIVQDNYAIEPAAQI